nr:30S ribosomal protein S17 [Thioalkalivibrio sp. HK1]
MQSASAKSQAEGASPKPKTIRKVVGQVVSDKMQKTVTVLVERKVKHPLYKKYIRRSTKMHAHDESETCRIGDRISIVQCRPISKTKSWRVHEIIRRSK